MRHTLSLSASRWITASALALTVGCTGSPTERLDSARQNGTSVVLPPASSSTSSTSSGDENGDSPTTPGSPGATTTTTDGGTDGGVEGEGCTLTQGYWKNHASKWPVTSLSLGNTSYTRAQLLAIFNMPTSGNGLVSMSHQLIAAKLNLAAGAAPAGIADIVSQADALIGALVVPPHGQGFLSTGLTAALNDALAAFNEGAVGPGHCDDGPPSPPGTPYPPSDPSPPTTGSPYPPSEPAPPTPPAPAPPQVE
jgi:hypothetical protein